MWRVRLRTAFWILMSTSRYLNLYLSPLTSWLRPSDSLRSHQERQWRCWTVESWTLGAVFWALVAKARTLRPSPLLCAFNVHPGTAHLYQYHLLVFPVYKPSFNSVGSNLQVSALRKQSYPSTPPPCCFGTQVWAGLVNTMEGWQPPANSPKHLSLTPHVQHFLVPFTFLITVRVCLGLPRGV